MVLAAEAAARELRCRVQGVSFPRSGHNLLRHFLQRYFGDTFHYCFYYPTCRSRPCSAPTNHFQKNHDFDLKLPVGESAHHVIQVRHPLYSIPSHYEFELVEGENGRQPTIPEDSAEAWRTYAEGQIQHWRAWVRKWLLSGPIPGALVLVYEDVVRDPVGRLGEAARFFAPSAPLDPGAVAKVVRSFNVRPRRSLPRFRHYDAEFFRGLESVAREELEALGYGPACFEEAPPPRLVERRGEAAGAALA